MTSNYKKEKLETSDRIYYRINWDTKADPKKTQIVYLDLGNLKTIPYHDWIPVEKGGEIPWHRIYKILYGGKVLWDRDERIYNENVFDEVDNFSNMGILKYIKEWKEIESNSYDTIPEEIKIFSLNCLFDIYDKHVTNLTPRLPLLVKAIEEHNADIVCLQEITLKMKTYILNNEFVRKTYYVSGNEPKVYGQIMLSKYKPKSQNLISLAGNQMKKYLNMKFNTKHDESVEIYNIHLTSDQQIKSNEKRDVQFEQLFNDVTSDKFIIVGDFNSTEKIDRKDIFDAWETLRGVEPGLTFDYEINKLASQTTKTYLQARLDRMIYKSITPKSIEVVCNEAIDNVWISDHFGLVSEFYVGNNEDDCEIVDYVNTSELTIKPGTALGVILEPSMWEPINKFRKRFDHSFKSWPPHVTVFQRFIVSDKWIMIKHNLDKLLTRGIVVTFDKVEIFQLTQNFMVVLTSSDPSEFQTIRTNMEDVVGMNIDSIPHITLGIFESEKQAKTIKSEVKIMLTSDGPFQVSLDTMTLMKKVGDQFQVFDYIGQTPRCDPIELLLLISRNISKETFKITTVGSRVYGVIDTDYDIVMSGDYSAVEFKRLFESYAKMSPHFKYAEVIESKLPTINLVTSDDIEINLIYIEQLGGKIYNTMALNMINIGNEVKRLVGDKFEEFCERYQMVRCWAQQRAIYGSNYGYLNGVTWLILTLNVFINNMELNKKPFIRLFFKYYNEYDWNVPININKLPYDSDTKADRFVKLANIIPPSTGIIRNISRPTWKIILDEFKRGNELNNNFTEMSKARRITSHHVILTVSENTVYDTIQGQRKIIFNIWKLPIRTDGIVPHTKWINDDGTLIYKLEITRASDAELIYNHFKGLRCSIEFKYVTV